MTDEQAPAANWQQPSLAGLRALRIEAMPGFEVLLLDDLAGYLMGAGPLTPPYTVQHGSRVVSALFGAIVNSASYQPGQAPDPSERMTSARQAFVQGAQAFADKGEDGLAQLVNRVIPAALGELEIHQQAPEEQTRSMFYYSILAVASGPLNLLAEAAAEGVLELFAAWDELFGAGFVPPWRQQATA